MSALTCYFTRAIFVPLFLFQQSITLGFRWDIRQDLALCIEVSKVRPKKPLKWLEIADSLSALFSSDAKEVSFKGKGCKERLQLLLRKNRDEDKKALKR